MVGKTFTYLLGSDAAALMFNSKNEELNAEDVYSKLTTPVFGKGVAYDVPNPVRPLQEPPAPPPAGGARDHLLSLLCCRSSWNRRKCSRPG